LDHKDAASLEKPAETPSRSWRAKSREAVGKRAGINAKSWKAEPIWPSRRSAEDGETRKAVQDKGMDGEGKPLNQNWETTDLH
jgi:hypothetical protein